MHCPKNINNALIPLCQIINRYLILHHRRDYYKLSALQNCMTNIILNQKLSGGWASIKIIMSGTTVECIWTSIKMTKLKTYKAIGPGEIKSRIPYEFSLTIAPILFEIYKKFYVISKITDDWKQTNIVAVFKNGKNGEDRKLQTYFTNMCVLSNTIAYTNNHQQ